VAKIQGKLHGISRMRSHTLPFGRHFIRIGDTALRGIIVPASIDDRLEAVREGSEISLQTCWLACFRVVVGVRLGGETLRISPLDFARVSLIAGPVIFLALFILVVWCLFSFGFGHDTQANLRAMAAPWLLPGARLLQPHCDARSWLIWR
jgi:hypothetical protein